MANSSTITFQEQLINHTQQLIADCLNSGSYPEAIALGELVKNLSEAYRDIIGQDGVNANAPVQPVIQIQRKPQQPAFGSPAFSNGTRTIPQSRPEQSKPTSYQWADGFSGVTLPTPPEQQGEDGDYWQDPRRQ